MNRTQLIGFSVFLIGGFLYIVVPLLFLFLGAGPDVFILFVPAGIFLIVLGVLITFVSLVFERLKDLREEKL